MRYTHNPEDAKDVLHDAFVKVFTRIDTFRENASLETWITRIMINTAIDFVKKRSKNPSFFAVDDFDEVEPADESPAEENDNPFTELTPEDALNMVQALPDKYRVVINLYAVDGFTHKEIAEKLGMSEGGSKSQLSRARKMLLLMAQKKKTLKEYENAKA